MSLARPAVSRLSLAFLLALAASGASCQAEKPSSVMVAVSTDAPVPEAFDSIEITALRGGVERYTQTYARQDGLLVLPGTLAVDRPGDDDSNDPLQIRVVARRGTDAAPVLLRTATMSFVDGEQRLLRMPLRVACLGVDKCPDGQSCRAGACESDAVDLQRNEVYAPELVFPNADTCFRPTKCEAAETIWIDGAALRAAVADGGCSVDAAFPEGIDAVTREKLNMEFVWTNDPANAKAAGGAGPRTARTLDFDEAEGWTFESPTRVRLSPGVCQAIREGRVAGTFETFGCAPKRGNVAACADATPLVKATP